jgi:hypothetical protein
MGAVIGMVVGYVLGTRAGDDGYRELKDAWKTISTSAEVKDMVVGGMAMAGDMLRQGRGLLAERLQPSDARGIRAA